MKDMTLTEKLIACIVAKIMLFPGELVMAILIWNSCNDITAPLC